jgi:hypothetical protein
VVDDDRFFLIEVKAERSDIDAEWQTKSVEDSHKKKALLALYECLQPSSAPAYADELIDLSLRGHLLAYWSEEHLLRGDLKTTQEHLKLGPPHEMSVTDRSALLDSVVVTPYLVGCLARCPAGQSNGEIKKYQSRYWPALKIHGRGKCEAREHIPLSILYDGIGRLLRLERYENELMIFGESLLGLDLWSMTNYINMLCSRFGASSEELHAVVMSRSGKFFRVISSTEELRSITEVSPAPDGTTIERKATVLNEMSAIQRRSVADRLKAEKVQERAARRLLRNRRGRALD